MRLYDRLIAHGGIMDPDADIMRFIADDVQAQINALPTDDTPDITDFGVCAPPFDNFWIESRSIAVDRPATVERGCFFIVLPDDFRAAGLDRPTGTHWQISATPYIYLEGTLGVGVGGAVVQIGADGTLLSEPSHMPVSDDMNMRVPRGTMPVPPAQAAAFMPVALKAIGLLHARTDVDHINPNRQQQRKHKRSGNERPLTDHYILRVGPGATPQTMSDVAQVAADTKRKSREHGVRGHFRYYSPDKPLFGHTSGMVWIPAHDRGDGGHVDKTYRIKP